MPTVSIFVQALNLSLICKCILNQCSILIAISSIADCEMCLFRCLRLIVHSDTCAGRRLALDLRVQELMRRASTGARSPKMYFSIGRVIRIEFAKLSVPSPVLRSVDFVHQAVQGCRSCNSLDCFPDAAKDGATTSRRVSNHPRRD